MNGAVRRLDMLLSDSGFSHKIDEKSIIIRYWLLKNIPMKTFIYPKVNVDMELTDVRQNGVKRQKGCI